MEENKEKGLTVTTIWLMIAVAFFFDTIQALLTPIIIGYFVPVVSYPTFWLWFKMKGLDFFSLKRAPTLGIGALVELIPGLDLLPAFTFTVARIALTNKFQSVVPGAGVTKLGIGSVIPDSKRPININRQNLEVARRKNVAEDTKANNLRVAGKRNFDSDVAAYNKRVAQGGNTKGFATDQEYLNREMDKLNEDKAA